MKAPLKALRSIVLTRHPSHQPLRTRLPLLPFRSLLRLGSTTVLTDGKQRVECNSVQGVKNSANKLLMKQCFTRAGVKTAQWYKHILVGNTHKFQNQIGDEQVFQLSNLPYPVISKSLYGSRGNGNVKHDTQAQLETWMRGKDLSNYIFEKFSPLGREYRLHITQDGCFYACRKLLLNTMPSGTWQLHDEQVSWCLETNPSFKKPNNWNAIVEDCVKAQRALGLDICAFDVMVQGQNDRGNRTNFEWLIVESASAPSFGSITLEKYLIEIPKVLRKKANV